MNRRSVILGIAAAFAVPSAALAQDRGRPAPIDRAGPGSTQIFQELNTAPRQRVRPEDRVTIQEFRRRPDLRRAAPSIDIQAINFEFASAEIPRSEYRKVREIADALERLAMRRRSVRILLEGHTDAVGSRGSNQVLSERRAESLRRVLVREFGIPPRMIETVGYGEDFLLIDTPYEDWRNRRVTLRRIDDFVR